MSNVLPIPQKKNLRSFYRTRFILVGSIALIISALIALAMLAPSYLMLAINRPATEAIVNVPSTGNSERERAFQMQTLIADLLPYSSTSTPMQRITRSLEVRPAGIVMDRITYSSDSGGQKQIVLRGTAKNREQINALRKALEGQGIYKKVSVPVGDLVGASGNQFTITLTLL